MLVLVVYGVLLALTYATFQGIPQRFIPQHVSPTIQWSAGKVGISSKLLSQRAVPWLQDALQGAKRGFVPQQDQGRIMASVQLPDSASLERTQKAALAKIERDCP